MSGEVTVEYLFADRDRRGDFIAAATAWWPGRVFARALLKRAGAPRAWLFVARVDLAVELRAAVDDAARICGGTARPPEEAL